MLRLLRRVTTDASIVVAAEYVVSGLTDAVLDKVLSKVVGQATGSAIASRRILLLAYAVAQYCRPIP